MSSLPKKLAPLSHEDHNKILASLFTHKTEVLSSIHKLYDLTDCLLVPGKGVLEVVAVRGTSARRQKELCETIPALAWDAWIGMGIETFRLKIGGKLVYIYQIDTTEQ